VTAMHRAPLVAQAFRPAIRRVGRPEGLRYVRNMSEFRAKALRYGLAPSTRSVPNR